MRPSGFTLIELLVVMAILGLLLAVMPMIGRGMLPSLQAKADAREVAATLRAARAEAIRDNRPTAVIFDVEDGRYGTNSGQRRDELGRGVVMKLVTATSEVVDRGIGRIVFFPDGASTGGEVSLTADGRVYAVSVDWFTGRVREAP